MSLGYSEWNTTDNNSINNSRHNTDTSNKRKTLKKLPNLTTLMNQDKKQEGLANNNGGGQKEPPKNVYMLNADNNDDDDGNLADYTPPPKFDPPPPPIISKIGQQKQLSKQSDDSINPEDYSSLDSIANEEYYKNIIPNGVEGNINGGMFKIANASGPSELLDKNLSEKLNYMIHLLEESREEKTATIAEELILYSFLGVFVIFVLDNFVKIGSKYTH